MSNFSGPFRPNRLNFGPKGNTNAQAVALRTYFTKMHEAIKAAEKNNADFSQGDRRLEVSDDEEWFAAKFSFPLTLCCETTTLYGDKSAIDIIEIIVKDYADLDENTDLDKKKKQKAMKVLTQLDLDRDCEPLLRLGIAIIEEIIPLLGFVIARVQAQLGDDAAAATKAIVIQRELQWLHFFFRDVIISLSSDVFQRVRFDDPSRNSWERTEDAFTQRIQDEMDRSIGGFPEEAKELLDAMGAMNQGDDYECTYGMSFDETRKDIEVGFACCKAMLRDFFRDDQKNKELLPLEKDGEERTTRYKTMAAFFIRCHGAQRQWSLLDLDLYASLEECEVASMLIKRNKKKMSKEHLQKKINETIQRIKPSQAPSFQTDLKTFKTIDDVLAWALPPDASVLDGDNDVLMGYDDDEEDDPTHDEHNDEAKAQGGPDEEESSISTTEPPSSPTDSRTRCRPSDTFQSPATRGNIEHSLVSPDSNPSPSEGSIASSPDSNQSPTSRIRHGMNKLSVSQRKLPPSDQRSSSLRLQKVSIPNAHDTGRKRVATGPSTPGGMLGVPRAKARATGKNCSPNSPSAPDVLVKIEIAEPPHRFLAGKMSDIETKRSIDEVLGVRALTGKGKAIRTTHNENRQTAQDLEKGVHYVECPLCQHTLKFGSQKAVWNHKHVPYKNVDGRFKMDDSAELKWGHAPGLANLWAFQGMKIHIKEHLTPVFKAALVEALEVDDRYTPKQKKMMKERISEYDHRHVPESSIECHLPPIYRSKNTTRHKKNLAKVGLTESP